MTYSVPNTAVTNTFDFWRTRTNELSYAMSNYVVTTESNTAVGNAAISGTMIASEFKISNSTGNWVLTPYIANNYVFSGTASDQNVDSFTKNLYSGAEYLLSVTDNNNGNNKTITKVLVTYDGAQTFMAEYGTISTNSSLSTLGSFNSTANATHVILQYNSSVSGTTVKFSRVAI